MRGVGGVLEVVVLIAAIPSWILIHSMFATSPKSIFARPGVDSESEFLPKSRLCVRE